MISIWKYKDYKKFLADILKAPGAPRGKIRALAEGAGCQPSYLSQVLNSKPDLLPDHAIGLAEALELSDDEVDYFLYLVEYARAKTKKLKERLEKKLNVLRLKGTDLKHRLERGEQIGLEAQCTYYSTWTWAAIHILVSIPACQTTSAIAMRLGLSEKGVISQLKYLETIGLVDFREGRWIHSGSEIHLPKDSPLLKQHLSNWRQKALNDFQPSTLRTSVHFSGVYAVAKSDIIELQEHALDCIKKMNLLATSSASEALVAVNIDFFEI